MLEFIFDFIFPPRKSEYVIRSLSKDKIDTLIKNTAVNHTTIPTITLFKFEDKTIHSLIHECKYHRSKKASILLAYALQQIIYDLVVEYSELTGASFVLIPIPLTINKKKFRGYNQIELVLEKIELPFVSINTKTLFKKHETISQTKLSRTKRIKNQQNVFCAQNINPHTTYFIVDDVLTTGATMQSAIDTLLNAGAQHIIPIAFAH